MNAKHLIRKDLSALVPQYPSNFSDMNHSQFTIHHSLKRKLAFTLAEVLITLAIIGIVAALTLPNLILSYKKHVVASKVKKFYTIMSQATNSAVSEFGPMENWQGFTSTRNGKEMQTWFDTYLKPYLKVIDEEVFKDAKTGYEYLGVVLFDGSAIRFSNWSGGNVNKEDNYNGLIHVRYYTDKSLVKDDLKRKDCVDSFSFLFYSPMKKEYYFQPYTYQVNTSKNYNRTFFMNMVKSGNTQYCSAIMMYDGWQIKDDYPWREK